MKTVEDVITIFTNAVGVGSDALFGDDRSVRVRQARQLLCYILRETCGLSSYALARMFGRTRRNIVRWLSITRDYMEIYRDVKQTYDNVMKRIEDAK